MQFLLSALGSAGDVHPFIAISQSLRARGHDVRIIASPHFEARIRRVGIDFAPLGAPGDYERMLQLPGLWEPRQGTRLILDELLRRLREAYDVTAAQVEDPDTVLVGSTLSWGMRLVQEIGGHRGATVHLSPSCLLSATDPARLPGGGDLSRLPAWSVRLLQWAGERLLLDRWIAPRLDRVRADLELAPVRRVWSRWIHSPDLVVGAWPEWFAPQQADWPSQSVTGGFPLYLEEGPGLEPAVEAFLAGGAPPVGVTPGSAMAHGAFFFERAIAACASLGLRAVLITPFREQLPTQLPPWACHVPYAPFNALLPRLAALVHHGGIGTSAQALAAGLPQIVVPFAHDQFDNAARLRRLGVSRTLDAKASLEQWIAAVSSVVSAAGVAAAVSRWRDRMAEGPPAAQAIATRLERLGER